MKRKELENLNFIFNVERSFDLSTVDQAIIMVNWSSERTFAQEKLQFEYVTHGAYEKLENKASILNKISKIRSKY